MPIEQAHVELANFSLICHGHSLTVSLLTQYGVLGWV